MTKALGTSSLFGNVATRAPAAKSPEATVKSLRFKVERERLSRREAEQLLEEKSRELYIANVKLKEFNNDLEFIVQERTAALQKSLARIEEQQRAAERSARHDALTGLPNRRYVNEYLSDSRTCWDRAALIYIDLDRFKQINDTLGHAAGDRLLCVVAQRLRDAVPEGTFVARMGGDEFVVIVRDEAEAGSAMQLARRIVDRIPEPIEFEDNILRFGASAGVATQTGHQSSPEAMIIEADLALYRAKEIGRGCAVQFNDDMRAAMQARRDLSDDLIDAFEKQQIRPYYQPRINAKTGQIACVEALARWHHPTRGTLPPGAFLPIAEDIGRLVDVDESILKFAIEDLKAWDAAGVAVPRISVNVSGRRLLQDDLFARLEELDLPRGRLSFELLESIFFDNADSSMFDRLHAIRAQGIDIEIDDFGSGHASINGLLAVQPDTFKIDGQLVQKVLEDPRLVQLLQSVVQIGQALGIKVVAEGVETEAHAEMCRDISCDQLQGYAIAKPLSSGDLLEFAKRRAAVG